MSSRPNGKPHGSHRRAQSTTLELSGLKSTPITTSSSPQPTTPLSSSFFPQRAVSRVDSTSYPTVRGRYPATTPTTSEPSVENSQAPQTLQVHGQHHVRQRPWVAADVIHLEEHGTELRLPTLSHSLEEPAAGFNDVLSSNRLEHWKKSFSMRRHSPTESRLSFSINTDVSSTSTLERKHEHPPAINETQSASLSPPAASVSLGSLSSNSTDSLSLHSIISQTMPDTSVTQNGNNESHIPHRNHDAVSVVRDASSRESEPSHRRSVQGDISVSRGEALSVQAAMTPLEQQSPYPAFAIQRETSRLFEEKVGLSLVDASPLVDSVTSTPNLEPAVEPIAESLSSSQAQPTSFPCRKRMYLTVNALMHVAMLSLSLTALIVACMQKENLQNKHSEQLIDSHQAWLYIVLSTTLMALLAVINTIITLSDVLRNASSNSRDSSSADNLCVCRILGINLVIMMFLNQIIFLIIYHAAMNIAHTFTQLFQSWTYLSAAYTGTLIIQEMCADSNATDMLFATPSQIHVEIDRQEELADSPRSLRRAEHQRRHELRYIRPSVRSALYDSASRSAVYAKRTVKTPLTLQQIDTYTNLQRFGKSASLDQSEVRTSLFVAKCVYEHLILRLQDISFHNMHVCHFSDVQCSICLAEFTSSEGPDRDASATEWIRSLPCRHLFHADCVSDWLQTKPTCPLCRSHVILLGRKSQR